MLRDTSGDNTGDGSGNDAGTDDTLTLGDLARDALRTAKNDAPRAIASLSKRIKKDPEYRIILDDIVASAVRTAVYLVTQSQVRNQRAAVVQRYDGRGAVEALARGIRSAILDFPLKNGLRLRDATRGDVSEQAEFYEKMSLDMGMKGRFLRLVLQHVPDGKTVGDVVSEKRASELWEASRVN